MVLVVESHPKYWKPREEYWSRLPIPFSRGSSRPRNPIQVSCIAGRFFTVWVSREAENQGADPRSVHLSFPFLLISHSLPSIGAGLHIPGLEEPMP